MIQSDISIPMNKVNGYTWFNKSLPRNIPLVRVMISGYESGLQDSTGFADLGDLAGLFRIEICPADWTRNCGVNVECQYMIYQR